MKDSTPKWLALTLLIGIAVLCFAIYSRYFSESAPNTNVEPPADAATNINPDNNQSAEPSADPISPEDPKIYSELPRAAVSTRHETIQHIGGVSAERLCEVYTLNGEYYIVFQSESDSYDVQSDTPSICVARLDNDLKLLKCAVLSQNEQYLSCKFTATGIFVITSGEDYSKLYALDFTLTLGESQYFEKAVDAELYFTSSEMLAFLMTEQKLCAKVLTHDGDLLRSHSYAIDGVSNIFSILPSANDYNIILCGEQKHSILTYNRNDGFSSENSYFNCHLKQFTPIIYDGAQGFLKVTESTDGSVISILDKDLAELQTTSLDATDIYCIPIDNNFAVFIFGENTLCYVYCEHLNFVLKINNTPSFSKILQADIYLDGYTLLTESENNLLLLDFKNYAFTEIAEYPSISEGFACIFNNVVFYSTTAKSDIFMDNFGESDVYCIRLDD